MAWQGDALAAVSAGRSVRGVHAMQPGLLGASHSLINTAAVPTAPNISPASAPGVVGLPTPHSQLCSVGKQGQAHIRATQLLSVSIHAGRAQPEEVMREEPRMVPTAGGKAGSACLCTQAAVCTERVTLQGQGCISPKQQPHLQWAHFQVVPGAHSWNICLGFGLCSCLAAWHIPHLGEGLC